jgi:hypothetical protein
MLKVKNDYINSIILLIAAFLLIFSIISFKSPDHRNNECPLKDHSKNNNLDSIPEYFLLIDTVYFDKIDDGKVHKSKYVVSNKIPLKYYLENISKVELMVDTILNLNPATYKEEIVVVVQGKMIKLYHDLINKESEKDKPDKNLIKKWLKDGWIKK